MRLRRHRPFQAGSAAGPRERGCPRYSWQRPRISKAEDAREPRGIGRAGGEILEGTLGHADYVPANKLRPLASALPGILETAFPLQNGPGIVVVLRHL